MWVAALIILLLIASAMLFIKGPRFGKIAIGKEKEKIKNSPNYRDGQFQNVHDTPNLKEGVSYLTVMRKFFFEKNKRSRPSVALPSVKTNLSALPPDKNVLVWFGHSSYFIQVDGKKILVDPVFSGNASPVKFTTKSFAGTDVYSVEDIPPIDFLFISHDHWDHLDFETITRLKPKINKIITGLGVAAHLERWDFNKDIIIERDWNEEVLLDGNFMVNITTGRHFSGRGLKRNQSLWVSFVLTTPTLKLFLGGDSGYDSHFKSIGEKFGPFDLAILECGQYNEYWKYIHMMPEETVQAALDLKAEKLMPVHWAKFSLSLHDWDDPVKRVVKESRRKNIFIITPVIGEEVNLDSYDTSTDWWVGIE
jgi:L-ascorbate metabolism protein UlaG (beta-lactamase superfamily)